MQGNLHYYYILKCSKRGMIFQRKFVQCREQIFGNGMRERSIFPFPFFFLLLHGNTCAWTLRDWHKSQKSRRHMVSRRYGDVCALSYSPCKTMDI